MAIIAEYLVNNIEDLPGLYTTAELWNRYRARLLHAIATPELAGIRAETTQSGQNFLNAVEELGSLLKKVRDDLSLEFDVPIVSGSQPRPLM